MECAGTGEVIWIKNWHFHSQSAAFLVKMNFKLDYGNYLHQQWPESWSEEWKQKTDEVSPVFKEGGEAE